jgi:hypothetical protein
MIHAIHPASGRRATFSEAAWELLPTGKDGLKDGWQVEVPEEVADAIGKKNTGKNTEKKSDKKGKNTDNVIPEETAGEGDPADEDDNADETNL